MECYQKCVEIGKRCASFKSSASCADCGKACRNNSLITSRTNCRCDTTTPACCQNKEPTSGPGKAPVPKRDKAPAAEASKQAESAPSKAPGQSAKEDPEHPPSRAPHAANPDDDGSGTQTWWQWLLSLFGFGGGTNKPDKERLLPDKSYKYKGDSHKPVEVINPESVLAEVREICDEIKKQKPEAYHPRVEQGTSPVALPVKEEKGSDTNLPSKSEEKKKKKNKKKPASPKSPNRGKYLGQPLEPSPKHRSPGTSPKRGASPKREGSAEKTEQAHPPGEEVGAADQLTTPVYLEAKRPPTSPIYSSERYLKPYSSDLCPVDPACQECCGLSASTQTRKSSPRSSKKKGRKDKNSSPMSCAGSPCLMCGVKQYAPRSCATRNICGSSLPRRPSPSRPSCPASPACMGLEHVTRSMRRRRRSASPSGRSSNVGRRRSSSCPSSPKCSCSPCCPPPCGCKLPSCPPLCPPPLPCCPPPRCPCPCPKPSCLPPCLCKTCCQLCSSISKTPTPCCPCPPSASANNKPAGCRVGPGCPCPITCTKSCCVPTCFPTPKQPCKAPSPSAYNQFHTFKSFAMKSYTKSRDNDALCRQLMAKYKVTAPDSVPFCPKPMSSTCGPCEFSKKIRKLPISSPTPVSGCSACGANCSGCNNNKLTSNACDAFDKYATSTRPSSLPQQMSAFIQFNTSPSHGQPRMEFRIPKRTPVQCIKETGPRSPCKEFMTTFNFPKETKKHSMVKDVANSSDVASTSGEKATESAPKSNKKSRKRSPTKHPKGESTERGQANKDQDNTSENKTKCETEIVPDPSLPSAVLNWRASTMRVNESLKARLSPKKNNLKMPDSSLKGIRGTEETRWSGFSPFKASTIVNESKYCSQKASCLISNLLSPIQKSPVWATKKADDKNGGLFYACAPKSLPEERLEGCGVDDRLTKKVYPSLAGSGPPLSLPWSQTKLLSATHRLSRKQLSPPAADLFPGLKFNSAHKLSPRSPISKFSFLSSQGADEDKANKTHLSKSLDQQVRDKLASITKDNVESTASKVIYNAGSDRIEKCSAKLDRIKTGSSESAKTEIEKAKEAAAIDDNVPSCLSQDSVEISQCLTTESPEVESFSLRVNKFDRVGVNADGSLPPSNCNVFDYISAESSAADTSSAREDDLLSHTEQLKIEEEEDRTEAEGDLLSVTEEKPEPILEFDDQAASKEGEGGEMSNVGTAVDLVHGDSVNTEAKIPKDNDGAVKMATAVNNQYNFPLFNMRFDLIPQKMDLLNITDLVLAGESSVDPAEFGCIGESAVDPVRSQGGCLVRESSCETLVARDRSNNNGDQGQSLGGSANRPDPPDSHDVEADDPEVGQTTNGPGTPDGHPQAGANSTHAAGKPISSDPGSQSVLGELLSCSGVKWRKVSQASDVDLKLIRLGKAAYAMKQPPVVPTAGSFHAPLTPQGPRAPPSSEQGPTRKPYMDLLKPGEVESSLLSTNIEELLRPSSSINQLVEYGTPV